MWPCLWTESKSITGFPMAAAELDRLAELAGEGRLTVRVADELPASRVGDAHRSLERRGVRGRFVLRFG
ncbi:zinc-binding dehydrogenase [Streptosporangium sp. NPDC001559]|uniref:zinc-binding dehydrogenase n=1 Tax=Streptosporangium sp. NPDC001559 TaxID=3366187 RepID=UPI0036EC0420